MLILRTQNAQDLIEGREPGGWADTDFAVVDDTVIGRIYKEHTPSGDWQWFLQVRPAPLPTNGITGTLDEAKAEIAKAYERYREANLPPPATHSRADCCTKAPRARSIGLVQWCCQLTLTRSKMRWGGSRPHTS